MFGTLFSVVFIQPTLNLLMGLAFLIPGHDLGLAIIGLTILVKLALYPLTKQQIKQQRAMQAIQPKIEEIRARLKDNKEAQAKELMELYATEKVNPAASCLPLLIQLPVLIGLYRALSLGLHEQAVGLLYGFVPAVTVSTHLLGVVDLSKPSYVLAVLAAVVQFFQTRQIMQPPAATIAPPPQEVQGTDGAKDESMASMMNKQMMYMMPIMTVVIGISLPAGLTLYWFLMSVLTVLQQMHTLKKPAQV